jgi:pSer/pThr/pTyr-binding forkhead associated (FHA) protein
MIGGGPIPIVPLTPANARLRVTNGPGAGKVFALEKMRILVGRTYPPAILVDVDLRECELGASPMISRRHAELQWVDGDLELVDLGSANGTYVDGSRLSAPGPRSPSPPTKLGLGAKIKFGNVELEVIRSEA